MEFRHLKKFAILPFLSILQNGNIKNILKLPLSSVVFVTWGVREQPTYEKVKEKIETPVPCSAGNDLWYRNNIYLTIGKDYTAWFFENIAHTSIGWIKKIDINYMKVFETLLIT